MLTMVLAGLWHGAGWTFVLWGTYHGLLLFIHHGLKTGLKIRWKGGWLGRAGTFLLVCFGWVLFKAADPADSLAVLHAHVQLQRRTAAASRRWCFC